MTSIRIYPSSLYGDLVVPPSKSMAHRTILAASLAKGTSVIKNVAYSDDILATIQAMKQCGVQIETYPDSLVINASGQLGLPSTMIDCNESGSTLRFLIPLMGLFDGPVSLTGKPRLLTRPLGIFETIFHQQELTFTISTDRVCLNGPLQPGQFHLEGNVSSQFITGLLFALPLLNGDSTITIDPPFESQSYVHMTVALLRQFGIMIEEETLTYKIKGNQLYTPQQLTIEGAYSQAAFFLVGGILSGNLHIRGLNPTSLQGDQAIVQAIKRVHGDIVSTKEGYLVHKSQVTNSILDIEDTPDLGPILALLLAFAKGQSSIVHATRLRLKESDRIMSTVTTLKALGAQVEVVNDEFVIEGVSSLRGGVSVFSFNDHRVVMMAAIAALRCENPIIIEGSEAIQKSYPSFFEDYQRLGGKVEVLTP